jgi:ML domain.
VKNTVFAKIAGIPFPFIGVDGTDACSKIFLPDGSTAGCPLKAGQEYVYKNAFKVLQVYPKVRIHVHDSTFSSETDDTIADNNTIASCKCDFFSLSHLEFTEAPSNYQ